jgi:hypothetical protein
MRKFYTLCTALKFLYCRQQEAPCVPLAAEEHRHLLLCTSPIQIIFMSLMRQLELGSKFKEASKQYIMIASSQIFF